MFSSLLSFLKGLLAPRLTDSIVVSLFLRKSKCMTRSTVTPKDTDMDSRGTSYGFRGEKLLLNLMFSILGHNVQLEFIKNDEIAT